MTDEQIRRLFREWLRRYIYEPHRLSRDEAERLIRELDEGPRS